MCDIFAGTVPSHLTRYWIENVGQQIIYKVEMYAYICVRWHLRGALDGRLGICFIDNEACRMSLVKRNSSSTAMLLLTSIVSIVDANRPFAAWFERVPSFSNLADMPSRGKSAGLCRLLSGRDCGEVVLPPFIFTFLMSGKFNHDLATMISFEAQPWSGLEWRGWWTKPTWFLLGDLVRESWNDLCEHLYVPRPTKQWKKERSII